MGEEEARWQQALQHPLKVNAEARLSCPARNITPVTHQNAPPLPPPTNAVASPSAVARSLCLPHDVSCVERIAPSLGGHLRSPLGAAEGVSGACRIHERSSAMLPCADQGGAASRASQYRPWPPSSTTTTTSRMAGPMHLLLLALTALLHLARAAALPLEPAGVLRGTLRELSGQRFSHGSSRMVNHQVTYLETAQHGHLPLALPRSLASDVQAGAEVQIRYSSQQDKRLMVSRIRTTMHERQRHRRRLLQSRPTAPKGKISMVIFIMDLTACGTAGPATTPEDMAGFLRNSSDQNLAGMYDTCSMGNVELDADNSLIMTVPFPCSGQLPDGSSFVTDTCADDNVVRWQTYAAMYAMGKGISLNRYQHRVLVLPKSFHDIMRDCNFDALSSQGRWAFDNDPARGNTWGYGLVWICGDCWNWATTFMHELGHNYGARHARNEYGPRPELIGNTTDYSSVMGSWGGDEARCHNAPQLWTMGWSTPAVQLDLSSLQPGAPAQLVSVPMQIRGPSGVRITVNASSYVLSYRGMRPPYDRPFLTLDVSEAVLVHRTPSGVQYTDTALVGMITAAALPWVDPASLLSATLVSRDATAATVAICRRVAAGTPCYQRQAGLEGPRASPKRSPVATPVRSPAVDSRSPVVGSSSPGVTQAKSPSTAAGGVPQGDGASRTGSPVPTPAAGAKPPTYGPKP